MATRFLLTRLSALGDIVHTWPLAVVLAQHGEVVWLVEERFSPLVALHPAVRHCVPVATKRWRHTPWGQTVRAEAKKAMDTLRALAPEVALDPQGLVKSALWAALAGIPRRLGFAPSHRRERISGLFYTETVTPRAEVTHVVDLNLTLAEALPLPVRYGSAPDGSFLRPHLPNPPEEAFAVQLFPGSGHPQKNWPPHLFAKLARKLTELGLPVTVFWGPGERAIAEDVVRQAPKARLAPPTDLLQLASCLAAARAVVGGDTGPIHLAASLGTPTVAVHVATDPARNAPRGPRVAVVSGARTGASRGRAATGAARPVEVGEVLSALQGLLTEAV
ncbi:MAG: lipopolysaccharide heptosyltransferase I [Acidobacteriota bacterium]